MPCRAAVGSTSSSIVRTRIEYDGCSLTSGFQVAFAGGHWASTIWLPVKLEEPM
jgi:hypothetical protein